MCRFQQTMNTKLTKNRTYVATHNMSKYNEPPQTYTMYILAKPLHNHDTVSVHFNYFYCTEICDKLSRDLAMLTYKYLNVDDCWLTSSMPQQRFKLQNLLNYSCNSRKSYLWSLVGDPKAVEVNWFPFTCIHANSITNSIHAWLTKHYTRWSGMYVVMNMAILCYATLHCFILLEIVNHLSCSVYVSCMSVSHHLLQALTWKSCLCHSYVCLSFPYIVKDKYCPPSTYYIIRL